MFLLLRLLGGLWLCLLVWLAVTWVSQFHQLGMAQDDRLRAGLAEFARQPADRRSAPPGTWRIDDAQGRWLAGDSALSRAVPIAREPRSLQYGDRGGILMRTGVGECLWNGADGPQVAVLQVAEPWSSRLPSVRDVFIASTWTALAMTVAMSLLVLASVRTCGQWLDEAAQALMHPDQNPARAGPKELLAAVVTVRALHAAQRRWVDDQRRFLADASHQLRTPMAVLRTQLQSAIAGDVLASELLPQMLHTVDRAAGMANNLLSLNKLEQLKRAGALPSVDLRQVARDTVVELAPLIAQKRLDFALEGVACEVPSDAVMLGELLRNLLANAIHHTPAGGALGVLLRAFAGRVELVVWDSGPGLNGDVQQRLFQPFSAAKGGVGLGLSICRQIAEAMNANVELYNRIAADSIVGVDAVVTWQQAP